LVSAEALRGGGGADSFVQFPLEKGSRKVYNYSTNTNRARHMCLVTFVFAPRGTRKIVWAPVQQNGSHNRGQAEFCRVGGKTSA